MPDKAQRLTVKIHARLAADYRLAYDRAFGQQNVKRRSLSNFIARFVEDRLSRRN
jgi:hypothetical protein